MEDESATAEQSGEKRIGLSKDLEKYVETIKKEDEEDIDVEVFDQNFNNFLTNEEPDVLVISDTHVGAIGSHAKLLDRTLGSLDAALDNGSKMQALLIIGDFFDYICQDPSGLVKLPEITNVFAKIDKLCSRINVKIALGNHEIPVRYGIGAFYNFAKKRDGFVKMLVKHAEGQFSTFLKPSNFCQYISITSDGSDKMAITTHVDLKDLKGTTTGKVLLSHGYQFFPGENDVFGIVWKDLMHNLPEAKEIIDILYNADIKKHSSDTVEGIHATVGKPGKYERLKLEDIKQARKQHDSWIKKREENNHDVNYRKHEIEKFLQKNKLTSYSKVIYGHTHKAEHFTISVAGASSVDVFNTGTWQHLPPNLIAIKLKDGQFSIVAKSWDKTTNAFTDME
jgi:UDP-2,3-diacylglucosamine pyrophosphatase LpxH